MAAPRPSGTATTRATTVITKVAETRGQTPKSGFPLSLGAHRVPPRNSQTGTSLKNSTAGLRRAMTMPTVVRTETRAAANRTPLITASPGRERPDRSTGSPRRPAGDGGPAGVVVEVVTRALQQWLGSAPETVESGLRLRRLLVVERDELRGLSDVRQVVDVEVDELGHLGLVAVGGVAHVDEQRPRERDVASVLRRL